MTLAENITEHIEPILELIILGLNVFSIAILLWGTLVVSKHFLENRFSKDRTRTKIQEITTAKVELGTYILLSLEFLIITDIIESTMQPSIEGLIRLALIVIIRTTLSFFLQKEILHEQAEQSHSFDKTAENKNA